MSWRETSIGRRNLDLRLTLFNGQAFMWTKEERDDGTEEFYGCIDGHIYGLRYGFGLSINCVEFCVLGSEPTYHHYARLLNYFNITIDLEALTQLWCKSETNYFARIASKYRGVRVLTTEPVECLISFISSSNNNIKRISQMLWSLCRHFPENRIETNLHQTFYRFPDLGQLSKLNERELRELGFGFRSPFIVSAVRQVRGNGGLKWLGHLSSLPRAQACAELQKLAGCGPKVANCVCMCSLQMFDSVPVDTHCLQLMKRHYLAAHNPLLHSPLTASRHDMLGDILRSIFGKFTSWAFMILFTAELADFRPDRRPTCSRFFFSAARQQPKNAPPQLVRAEHPEEVGHPRRRRSRSRASCPPSSSRFFGGQTTQATDGEQQDEA